MTESDETNSVDRFLLEQIDSVPHLEALLMLWNTRPRMWSVKDVAHALFINAETAGQILEDLTRRGLIVAAPAEPARYSCEPQADRDRLLASVHAAYRSDLVRLSSLIHTKPPAAVRDFARAFRAKETRE